MHTNQNKKLKAGADNDGLKAEFFGPPMWFTIHSVAAGFPSTQPNQPEKETEIDTDKRRSLNKSFFLNLIEVLLYKDCRVHSRKHKYMIERANFQNMTPRDVGNLMFDFHNCVNREIHKPVKSPVDLRQIRRLYESGRVGLMDGTDRTQNCGHSTVVVRPQDQMQDNQSSVLIHKSCLL